MSYASAAKTKTHCIYEGPSEAAIRQAATANALPIDSISEAPASRAADAPAARLAASAEVIS